ncbi:hypothetical protein AX14_013077 [Amanita brunnescens Koide BX004]|nr:hypothetical protein AX14_013077 [Amanita brunnescens Koide BX004]
MLPRVLLIKISTPLQGSDEMNNARPHNLELALEQQENPVHTVKLTYHPGKKYGDKNTYTGEVMIGKEKIFQLEFSTGSSDLWVGRGRSPYDDCNEKKNYTTTSDAGVSAYQVKQSLKHGLYYPQHGIDGLFQGLSPSVPGREAARRADNVKVGGITVKQYKLPCSAAVSIVSTR